MVDPAAIWMLAGNLKLAIATSTKPVLSLGSVRGAIAASSAPTGELPGDVVGNVLGNVLVVAVIATVVVVVAAAVSAFSDPQPARRATPMATPAIEAMRAVRQFLEKKRGQMSDMA